VTDCGDGTAGVLIDKALSGRKMLKIQEHGPQNALTLVISEVARKMRLCWHRSTRTEIRKTKKREKQENA